MEGSPYIAVGITAAAVGALSLLLHFVIVLRSGAWGMSDRLGEMEKRLLQVIAEHNRDGDAKIDRAENNFGESLNAIRTHVHKIETWARDEFVRRSSFETALDRIEKLFERSDQKLTDVQQVQSKMAQTQSELAATVAAAIRRSD